MESLGKIIQQKRKNKKITQKKLAEMINKSEITIRKYESDEISPPLNVLQEIAKSLNVHISELTYSGENILKVNKVEEIIYGEIDDTLCKFLKVIDEIDNVGDPYGELKYIKGQLSTIDRYIDLKLKSLEIKKSSN